MFCAGSIAVDITGVEDDTAVNFWSSLYRSYISPMDLSGDNPLWNSTEPYFDSVRLPSYLCSIRYADVPVFPSTTVSGESLM